ncbi:Fe-S cluster assembly scaffold SufA [Candidatus Palibaumannia cicadellinicola]|uniref:Iron binding protein SufA for iron-sulfur cluster assembly n=1 Tax=Candidatus Palibaumannia cicadellinicola TaxID=186490 RepID=A0A088NB89_9GAMM|nr:Fe-S cluster assembly scaffold SufA [Candidatus Baumannia cicadellinicola]AIN47383.1 Iron binding protein SufA for iron-sulfur cluster assembly [Candidatus Baumannia cicadellinicola]
MQVYNKLETCYINNNVWCGITITDSAARQIKHLVTLDNSMLGLRLSVKNSGCAGLSYVIDKVTVYNETDLVYQYEGAKLFVALQAMPFIDGTQLDYVKEGLNYEFKFYNPKAQHICGCGESFAFGVVHDHDA